MTTTESIAIGAVTVDDATSPVGIYAGAVNAAPTPISDRARDYLNLDSLFTAEELAQRDKVRAFVDPRIRPNIARWYEDAHFPREIAPEIGELGVLGMHLKGYGCPARGGPVRVGALELEAATRSADFVSEASWRSAPSPRALRGAEAAVAAGHGPGRGDRVLRADRTHRRQRPRRMTTFARKDG